MVPRRSLYSHLRRLRKLTTFLSIHPSCKCIYVISVVLSSFLTICVSIFPFPVGGTVPNKREAG